MQNCEVNIMRKPVRYGIISTASIVPRFVHGMNLTNSGHVTAIGSRDLSKAEKLAADLKIPASYGSYEAVIDNPNVDALYIPLVNSMHYEYAKKALLNNKHVLVEKPFVLHKDQAVELAEIAEERKLFLSEAVKTPFLPVYGKIKRIIAEETYGKIHFMEFRQSYTGGSYTEGWNTQKEAGGGVLYGNEAYFFHMAEYLGGRVQSVNGCASFSNPDHAEDQCALSAILEGNIIAALSVSQKVLFNNGLTIRFDKARIEIPDYWKASKACVYQNDELIETIEYECRYEFVYELTHYNECILNGLVFSPLTPVSSSARYIGYCEDLYRSFKK